MGWSSDPLWAKEIFFLKDGNPCDFTKDDSFIHTFTLIHSFNYPSIHPFDHLLIKRNTECLPWTRLWVQYWNREWHKPIIHLFFLFTHSVINSSIQHVFAYLFIPPKKLQNVYHETDPRLNTWNILIHKTFIQSVHKYVRVYLVPRPGLILWDRSVKSRDNSPVRINFLFQQRVAAEVGNLYDKELITKSKAII